MLDLFSIFTKGGIVLWYFQGTTLSLTPAVNSLIKTVLLQVSESTKKTGLGSVSQLYIFIHTHCIYLYMYVV